MKKSNVVKLLKGVQTAITKHSPEILTGIGIAGMITTTVLAVKATPKAARLLEDERNRQNYELVKEARLNGYDSCEQIDKLKPLEVIKVAWKPYIPAAITCVLSVTCLVGASSVSLRRNAAIATAYKLSETALTEYRDKVIETVGEKKEEVIRDKVAEEKIKNDPVTKSDVIITQKGDTLCYDTVSGRYFKSDIEKIKRAVNELNRRMTYDVYVSLNEFYDELDLEHTVMGDDLGWNIDNGLIDVDFSAQIADDGNPCIVVNYRIAPRYDYSRLI